MLDFDHGVGEAGAELGGELGGGERLARVECGCSVWGFTSPI